MDGFPSGQRGQTVNLLATLSVVRIHLHPFLILRKPEMLAFLGKELKRSEARDLLEQSEVINDDDAG